MYLVTPKAVDRQPLISEAAMRVFVVWRRLATAVDVPGHRVLRDALKEKTLRRVIASTASSNHMRDVDVKHSFCPRNWFSVFALSALTAALLTPSLGAEPARESAASHPRPRTVTDSWKLDFTWQTPRPIAMRDAEGAYQWYWYMPYEVVNNSGKTVLFIPEITIVTDTGEFMTAGRNIPAGLFTRIDRELDNPLLENPLAVVGELLEGEDNARESVAIWPAFKDNVTEMTVFVAGISGETTTVRNPVTDELVMMRRTLMIQFRLPGNPPTPQRQPVVHEDTREVMR